jgi:Putative beta-barrel porin-2, OmpL-like. bbp2
MRGSAAKRELVFNVAAALFILRPPYLTLKDLMTIQKSVLFGVVLFATLALGQTAPAEAASDGGVDAAADAGTPPAPPPWYTRVKVEGMVDAYYSFRFQGTPSQKVNELRVFDVLNNTFALGFAKVAVSYPVEPVGFRLDVGFGPTAAITATDLPSTGVVSPAPLSPVFTALQAIEQAYASVKLGGLVTVDVGKFVTSAGSEVIEANNNWLQSRSMNFGYAIPFAHAGIRASMPVGDLLTLQVGVLNGWDSVLTSLAMKTFNVSAALNLTSGTSIFFNFYGGPQTSDTWRLLFDVVVNQNIGDKVALNLGGDVVSEGSTSWYGASLMGKVQLSDLFRLSARVEYFGDPNGARTGIGDSSYFTATLGGAFIITGLGNYEIRPEIRHDQQLAGATSAYVNGTSKSQTTVSVAAVAWF